MIRNLFIVTYIKSFIFEPIIAMNFLAHLFLSCNDDDLTLGNFLADFIRNKEVSNYSEGVQKGIALHRKIDTYTDNHPLVRKGTKRLQPFHHKYAPVVLDVLYDYVLANNWQKYSDEPLQQFTGRIYEILMNKIGIMPLTLKTKLPLMVADDWLLQYGKEKGLKKTFDRMKKRTSFPAYIDGAVDNFLKDYQLYEQEFNEFFPQAIDYVRKESECQANKKTVQ